MKKISALLLVIIILLGCSNNEDKVNNNKTSNQTIEKHTSKNTNDLVWHTNLEKAIEVAGKENKPILMQFSGSDWCKWCIKLNEEVMFTKEFADYAKDNIVLINFDYPRSIPQSDATKAYNQEMLNKYGVRGFPTVLLLDKTGKVVKQTGYQSGGPLAYIAHIKDAYASK